jgi:soluble lytic murein transglycosylase
MQLMPATAKHMAEKLEIGFDVDRLLTDADYNLLLGSAYIERLIARYDGSLLLAIAAYNAGPTRVNRWLDDYGDPRTGEIGPIDWIESMPISETRNYVQRVFESYMIYRHRVAPTRVALALDGDHLLAPQNDMADEPGPASCCL